MGRLGARATSRKPSREREGKDAKADTGALDEALEHEHRHTVIRGSAAPESYHREFYWEQAKERFKARSKTLVGIDLFVGHVKKARNRARAPSPSLICLN
jgi:hypothetical protein